MIEFLLFIFLWLIGSIICTVFLVRCIRFGRKFELELQQRYPEVVEKRNKMITLWQITFPVRFNPHLNDMIDEELNDLKRKAIVSSIGLCITFGLMLIVSFLLHLIFGW
jgi:hypothetical protein